MRLAAITFLAGLALLAGVVAVTLGKEPLRTVPGGAKEFERIVAGQEALLARTLSNGTICEPSPVLPTGVSEMRLSMWAFYGAQVHLTVFDRSGLVTEGTRGAEWTGDSVTVPVVPLATAVHKVRICLTVAPNSQPMLFLGHATKSQVSAVFSEGEAAPEAIGPNNAPLLGGRVTIEYLAPSGRSWWSRLESVARHLGLGRAFSGTWIALLLAALMAGVAVLAVRFTLRELP